MNGDDYPSGRQRDTRCLARAEIGPLIAGSVLLGIGGVIALARLAIAGSHVAAATRQWVRDMEVPPGQLARPKWEQARTAAAAGAAVPVRADARTCAFGCSRPVLAP